MRHSQESWHNWGVMQRVKGQLNASTEHVLNETLSRVITLDGISAPDALSFHIQRGVVEVVLCIALYSCIAVSV